MFIQNLPNKINNKVSYTCNTLIFSDMRLSVLDEAGVQVLTSKLRSSILFAILLCSEVTLSCILKKQARLKFQRIVVWKMS